VSRSRPAPVERRAPPTERPIRLDLLVNPYGPSIRVLEAIAAADDLHWPSGEREGRIRERLSAWLGVPTAWLTLASGVDQLLTAILLWRRSAAPVVLFPPSDPSVERHVRLLGVETVTIPRSHRFALDLDPATLPLIIPTGATGLVMSPNDPTGTLLSPQDAVRLIRHCAVVVVDERHGDYSGRSLLPLAREFDNLIIIQTMETWAGLAGLPFAYAIAPPRLSTALAEFLPGPGVPASSLVAAEATLDDLDYVRATVQRVAAEKSRLSRTLRKLNMVRPLPSWANFLLVRAERGSADLFERELAQRDILVHRPPHPELHDCLRLSAVSPEATQALKLALIDIGAGI
jgi:histidinol-phosphate aminotransferase